LWELNEVVAIRYRRDYIYNVTFDDGVAGEIDFAEFIGSGPVFEPLKDLEVFRTAHVEGGTICWTNGADIAPETLYERLESQRPSDSNLSPKSTDAPDQKQRL
jgi:hypothetical protein